MHSFGVPGDAFVQSPAACPAIARVRKDLEYTVVDFEERSRDGGTDVKYQNTLLVLCSPTTV
jgi:hypothetical protein